VPRDHRRRSAPDDIIIIIIVIVVIIIIIIIRLATDPSPVTQAAVMGEGNRIASSVAATSTTAMGRPFTSKKCSAVDTHTTIDPVFCTGDRR
jgi:hypothetical protein